jgi:preprotein translocase subunit YajC
MPTTALNPAGVPYSRIAQLTTGAEILIGPDFYAEVTAVEAHTFTIRTEYGSVMRISPDAIHAIAE